MIVSDISINRNYIITSGSDRKPFLCGAHLAKVLQQIARGKQVDRMNAIGGKSSFLNGPFHGGARLQQPNLHKLRQDALGRGGVEGVMTGHSLNVNNAILTQVIIAQQCKEEPARRSVYAFLIGQQADASVINHARSLPK